MKQPLPLSLHKVVSCGDTHKEPEIMIDEEEEEKRKEF